MEKKTNWFTRVGLQCFAEDPAPAPQPSGDPTPQPPVSKYSDQDYLKLKALFDKEASEKASLKKQLQAKQSDEEKKAEEEANKQTEFENMRKELATLKTKAKLSKAFNEEETETLSQCIVEGDLDKLTEAVVKIRTESVKRIKDEALKEFRQSSHIPGSSDGGESNSFGKQMANSFKKEDNSSKKNWGQFKNE